MLLKYIRTKRFLQEIAKHLAPYTTYSKAEYVCEITNKHIWVLPEIRIFPNRYNRRDADRELVVDHVMQNTFLIVSSMLTGLPRKKRSTMQRNSRWAGASTNYPLIRKEGNGSE